MVWQTQVPSEAVKASSSASIGGYDHEFVKEVPACTCVIYCDQHYCQSCLLRKMAVTKHRCAKVGNFAHVLHKGLRSEIIELKVRCSNRKLGCPWIRELAAL